VELVCPICNGMNVIRNSCPLCGHEMVDGGSVQDYYGPYSPYIEQNAYGDLAMAGCRGICIHLLYCPACGYDRRERVEQVEI
jgi:hypothetical protein